MSTRKGGTQWLVSVPAGKTGQHPPECSCFQIAIECPRMRTTARYTEIRTSMGITPFCCPVSAIIPRIAITIGVIPATVKNIFVSKVTSIWVIAFNIIEVIQYFTVCFTIVSNLLVPEVKVSGLPSSICMSCHVNKRNIC
jgi:hypothetical protein